MEDLYLDLIDGNLALDEKETWKIENDSTADWAIEKIQAENEEYRRFEMLVNNKIEILKEKLLKAQDKRESTIGFFTNKLHEYFNSLGENRLKITKTTASYKLASGSLKLKHQSPEIKRNDDVLIEWLKESNKYDFIELKETVKWADLKKTLIQSDNNYVTEDGEYVMGIDLIERPDKFEVEAE